MSYEVHFLSKIGLKKKPKIKERSIRRKKFFYYRRIKIKSTFSRPHVRCGEQLKAFTVNLRHGCQLISICALGHPFLSEATFRHQRFKHLKKSLLFSVVQQLSRDVHVLGKDYLFRASNNLHKLFCCPRHLSCGSGKINWRNNEKNDYKNIVSEFYTYLHYCLHSNATNNVEA